MASEEQGDYLVILIAGMTGAEVANQLRSEPFRPDAARVVLGRHPEVPEGFGRPHISRDEILESVYFGNATPRQATIPSAASYYKPEWIRSASLRQVRSGRDQLGCSMRSVWTERDGDGFRKRSDGKTVQIIRRYTSDVSGTSETVHELVKEYWEEIGVKVLLKPEEYAIYLRTPCSAVEHDVIGTWPMLSSTSPSTS